MPLKVSNGDQAVASAKNWLGVPYCWGGGHGGGISADTAGICVDCSGLVNQVYGTSGNTQTQVQLGTGVSGMSDAAPGDLIFFGPLAPGEPHHVGIYTGVGMMIDAPHTGTNVRYDTVLNFGAINAIRRLVPAGSAGNGTGPAGGNALYTYGQLEAVWIQAGGNAQYDAMAAAIAMAESGGDPHASNTNSNGSVDRGLWQINDRANGAGSSFDIMTNARAAVAISHNGTNWRPWCTAYSDAACGTKGGVYQGPGSPYMKYYSPNTAPDYSAPVNATNAAILTSADKSGGGGLTPLESDLGIIGCVMNPVGCADSAAAGVIKAVISSILTPFVQVVAGALGVGAGVVLMIVGTYLTITSTRTGRQAQEGVGKGVRLGAQIVAPESRLAGARKSTYERQLPGGQTQITTVVGRRRRGQYQQRTVTNVYGRPGASPGAPGGPSRPRDDLRDAAASYGGPDELGRPPRPRPAYGGPGSRGGRTRR